MSLVDQEYYTRLALGKALVNGKAVDLPGAQYKEI
jgi:hypothetical protein